MFYYTPTQQNKPFLSKLLLFSPSLLYSARFKCLWHVKADKWDIFFSARRVLILHIYMLCPHACLHTHDWIQEEPGGQAWGYNKEGTRNKNRRWKYRSHIFRGTSRNHCLRPVQAQNSTKSRNSNEKPDQVTVGGNHSRGLPNQTFLLSLLTWNIFFK